MDATTATGRSGVGTLHVSARARSLAPLIVLAITACSGRSGSDSITAPDRKPSALDVELLELGKITLGLTGDPAAARGAVQTVPDDDPLVKLGQLLFFSQSIAANYDVSCGTCHHPDFGMSDGLSISVGVVPVDASAVGPDRRVDAARDLDPAADGGPNMHRNSLTTLNAALFDRALMYDGRVFVLDDETVPGGHGQAIQTPESGQRADADPLTGLLEFTMKGPIVNDNEMRGFAFTNYATPVEYRGHLAQRLRGEVDTDRNADPEEAAANWLARFRAAFDQPDAAPDDIITVLNIQRALAAYVASQIFVDTPWRDYLAGDLSALDDDAKRGALLFLKPKDEGGLGCAACHGGDRFADEDFHNVGFPQLGRGFLRSDHSDFGRWMTTRKEEHHNAFRTPTLLNVAMTAPYGHAGSFATLEETIRYHADPRSGIESFDFSLAHLDQFRRAGIVYEHAELHSREAIAQSSFDRAEERLPARALTDDEVSQLVAFLEALTDPCVADPSCIGRWAPGPDDDPDGHTLIRDTSQTTPDGVDSPTPGDYPELITLAMPPTTPRTTFADVEACTDTLAAPHNTGEATFVRRETELGAAGVHGYSEELWFSRPSLVEVAMIAGGVSAAYADDDCWPDLIFVGGDASGMVLYKNLDGSGFEPTPLLPGDAERQWSGTAIADLNGDYRRELLLGNVRPDGEVAVYAQNGAGLYEKAAALPMNRPTYGISFAPLDASGYPYFYLAHWSASSGTEGTAPALWKSDGTALRPWDVQAGTTSAEVDQRFNFTPKFADFTGDGLTDLVIASDFQTSTTLRNVGGTGHGPRFANETDRRVITDENGMGSALLDIDNDGNLEWFVTSVYSTIESEGNWGITGNRLYRNVSTPDKIAFEDITSAAGVRNGYWGWGACAADFDNNGFIDLFHVNGFGYIPEEVATTEGSQATRRSYQSTTAEFQQKPARLFINDGDGSFTESAADWNIADPSEGRGLACLDFDRDGDIDVTVFDHSTGLQLFENLAGSGAGRAFLNVRVVGAPPNTDAIGARVRVTADVGNGNGVQTQLRLAEANSNFNSQNLPDLHFGLGQATVADVIEVTWPSGNTLTCAGIPVNRYIVLDERAGDAACPSGP